MDDRQEILDHIRMQKLVRRGWVCVPVTYDKKNVRLLLFLEQDIYKGLRGYPRGSAILRHHADFIYDVIEKKFTKQSIEIAVSAAEEVLYGRS